MIMTENTIKILFLGDIVGKPGRLAVKSYLEKTEDKPDFIIANAENASHGFGLTKNNYEELLSYGIDCFTSGNHIWDKREIFQYIDETERLIRPINYPENTKGRGYGIYETSKGKIGVINVLGRTFMNFFESPWELVEKAIKEIKKETNTIIIDVHAEASAEKICMGKYFSAMGASAIFGTHTHVQTADEKIINNFTGYITDAGFCGDVNGVIGMDYEVSINRLRTLLPERLDVSDTGISQVNGVMIQVASDTGQCVSIKRINEEIVLKEEKVIMKG